MGPKHSPHYADIFMARKIDKKIEEISKKYEEGNIEYLKRFLDDIFKIYCGTTKRLRLLFNEMNAIHPSIKLSMSHTLNKFEDASTQCDCQDRDSILFLDTLYKIASGRLILDLYKKPKDRNMYLFTLIMSSSSSS